MPSIKRNITANFVGRIVTMVMSILFAPVYIKYIGIEAYGVIGFFITIQTVLSLMDFGMGSTINREMASLSISTGNNKQLLDTYKTFEYIYWTISFIACGILIALSGYIAHQWLNKNQLDHTTVQKGIIIMAINFFFQFPFNMYNNALLGLQKQVAPNFISAGAAIVKAIGSILVLKYLAATLIAFLTFQALCTFLQVSAVAFYLNKTLFTTGLKARFSKNILVKNWKFTAGIFLTSVLVVLLTQVDKLLLSRMIPLQTFGYYVLAAGVASNLEAIILPISTAYFPQFTQLNASKNDELLKRKFHESSQLIALIVIPIGSVMFFLSKQVLFVWTGNSVIAQNTYILLSILICGMTFNTLMTIPYVLTLAAGWAKFGYRISIVALVFLIPFIFYSTKAYGAMGGASAWALLNIGFLLFAMQYFFSRLMKNEKLKWYWNTVLLPLTISIPLGIGFYYLYNFIPLSLNRWGQLLFLGVAYCVIAANIVFIAYRRILYNLIQFVTVKRIRKQFS